MVRDGRKASAEDNALEQPGYRNGYGKKRRFTLSLGTIEIRRPRVRNLDERFGLEGAAIV